MKHLKQSLILATIGIAAMAAQENTTFSREKESPVDQRSITYAADEVKVLGDLDFGQRSSEVTYSATPRYRAFVFSAFGGETVEVTVAGADRTAFVALADSTLNQLVSGNTNLMLSLPNRGPTIEVWYIVFRDVESKPARFTVQVKKLPGPGQPGPPTASHAGPSAVRTFWQGFR